MPNHNYHINNNNNVGESSPTANFLYKTSHRPNINAAKNVKKSIKSVIGSSGFANTDTRNVPVIHNNTPTDFLMVTTSFNNITENTYAATIFVVKIVVAILHYHIQAHKNT